MKSEEFATDLYFGFFVAWSSESLKLTCGMVADVHKTVNGSAGKASEGRDII